MAEQPFRDFTAEEIEDFHRDGVVVMRGALTDRWIDHMREAIDAIVARPPNVLHPKFGLRGEGSVGDLQVAHTHPAIWEFILNSPMGALTKQLMKSSQTTFLMDQVVVKGRSMSASPWHQDGPYIPLKGAQVLTAWTPFEHVTRENGMLGFVRGSHDWNRVFQAVETSGNFKDMITEDQEPLPDIEADRESFDIFQPDMAPGDIAFFSVWTIHGGALNRTDRPRRAYTTRWIGDDVIYTPTPQTEYMNVEPGLLPGGRFAGARYPVIA